MISLWEQLNNNTLAKIQNIELEEIFTKTKQLRYMSDSLTITYDRQFCYLQISSSAITARFLENNKVQITDYRDNKFIYDSTIEYQEDSLFQLSTIYEFVPTTEQMKIMNSIFQYLKSQM